MSTWHWTAGARTFFSRRMPTANAERLRGTRGWHAKGLDETPSFAYLRHRAQALGVRRRHAPRIGEKQIALESAPSSTARKHIPCEGKQHKLEICGSRQMRRSRVKLWRPGLGASAQDKNCTNSCALSLDNVIGWLAGAGRTAQKWSPRMNSTRGPGMTPPRLSRSPGMRPGDAQIGQELRVRGCGDEKSVATRGTSLFKRC